MKNRYNVPARQWKKWGVAGQKVFNRLYGSMRRAQHLYLHPKATRVPQEQWETTAHNAAWIAAGVAAGLMKEVFLQLRLGQGK
jgi:hypothetical protein